MVGPEKDAFFLFQMYPENPEGYNQIAHQMFIRADSYPLSPPSLPRAHKYTHRAHRASQECSGFPLKQHETSPSMAGARLRQAGMSGCPISLSV